jgi:hypothetical protein
MPPDITLTCNSLGRGVRRLYIIDIPFLEP